jgi:hypothetical protein
LEERKAQVAGIEALTAESGVRAVLLRGAEDAENGSEPYYFAARSMDDFGTFDRLARVPLKSKALQWRRMVGAFTQQQ